jgi:hypothetical protein
MAEEDVEFTLNCRGVTLLRDSELGSQVSGCHGASSGVPAAHGTRGEVGVVTVLVETGISGASLCEAIVSVILVTNWI